MNKIIIPAEVIVHFDTEGKITPYRIRFEDGGIKIIKISKLLKRTINTFAGNPVEIYECSAQKNGCEILFILNFERNINKWFLSKY